MSISSVCVYCGSSNKVDERYKDIARTVGTALAQQRYRVIYGGGHVGLMGLMADAALQAGGEVIGIIPEHIRAKEVQHMGLTELHVVDSMHVRKQLMEARSDAFIILPGGFGTLDECFEILTWRQLGLHAKPVIIYNEHGFWTPLLALIDHLLASGFAPPNNRQFFQVANNVAELLGLLAANPTTVASDPSMKWA
jgi:uncharacterized protein (TIGR00730 family)